MNKVANVSGKRKRAVARASIKAGSGRVTVNDRPLEVVTPRLAKMRIMEPLLLSEGIASTVDISIRVNGGGVMSQANAVRLAVARALVEHTKDKKLEKRLLDYDRTLLVADVRRKETRKPNDSKARAARQKSYR
jgi:small subunit ribosomal protein S9